MYMLTYLYKSGGRKTSDNWITTLNTHSKRMIFFHNSLGRVKTERSGSSGALLFRSPRGFLFISPLPYFASSLPSGQKRCLSRCPYLSIPIRAMTPRSKGCFIFFISVT